MARQLSANSHIALTGLQTVNRTNVVQATTGHKVATRGISAGHHPAGAQWDSMHLRKKKSLTEFELTQKKNPKALFQQKSSKFVV